jgi:hypothetical protein
MSVWRCDKTGNPCGTDTVVQPCLCQACRMERALRSAVEAEREACADRAKSEMTRIGIVYATIEQIVGVIRARKP